MLISVKEDAHVSISDSDAFPIICATVVAIAVAVMTDLQSRVQEAFILASHRSLYCHHRH